MARLAAVAACVPQARAGCRRTSGFSSTTASTGSRCSTPSTRPNAPGRTRGAVRPSPCNAPARSFLWTGHSYVRKALEAYYTVLMEALLSKRRILELVCQRDRDGAGRVRGRRGQPITITELDARQLTMGRRPRCWQRCCRRPCAGTRARHRRVCSRGSNASCANLPDRALAELREDTNGRCHQGRHPERRLETCRVEKFTLSRVKF